MGGQTSQVGSVGQDFFPFFKKFLVAKITLKTQNFRKQSDFFCIFKKKFRFILPKYPTKFIRHLSKHDQSPYNKQITVKQGQ